MSKDLPRRITITPPVVLKRSRSPSYPRQQNVGAQASSSRLPRPAVVRSETIVISDDDEEDDMEEIEVREVSRTGSKIVSKQKDRLDGRSELDWEAKDALKVKLSKLDAEVRNISGQVLP